MKKKFSIKKINIQTQAPGLGKLFLESVFHCSRAPVMDLGRVDMISEANTDTLDGRLEPILSTTP